MILIEAIGIVGTILILISMCFKTSTFRSTLCLRIFNLIGSVLFVTYGIFVPAISTAVLNGALIIVNAFHIFVLFKNRHKKNINKEDSDKEDSDKLDKPKEDSSKEVKD